MDEQNFLDYKQHRISVLMSDFRQALETTQVTVDLQSIVLVVGTTNDKTAYTDVWFSLLNDLDKAFIKDQNGQFVELTKVGIHFVISKMVDMGKGLWAKKETLLKKINDATTFEEVELVEW